MSADKDRGIRREKQKRVKDSKKAARSVASTTAAAKKRPAAPAKTAA